MSVPQSPAPNAPVGVLAPVRYHLRIAGWKGAPWHVRRFEMTEGISEPYRLSVEAITDSPWVDLDELLGDPCVLEIDRQASPRTIHGLVLGAEDLGRHAARHLVRLEIGPAWSLLAQRIDTRAWQERSAPEVLQEVLAGPLAELGRSIDLSALDRVRYPRREYCVQYRESDLAFASRLMEEEGIAYHFDHDHGDAEVMVLVDDNHAFPRLHDDALSVVETSHDTAAGESVQGLRLGRRLTPTSVSQRAYEWQRPGEPHAAQKQGQDHRGRTREVYDHDDRVYPEDAERLAKIKQERLRAPGQTSSGESNATALRAGGVVGLHGHGRASASGDYVITRVRHRGECPEEMILGDASVVAARYTNTFECLPLAVPFRPLTTVKKPQIAGIQTATVTGPPGEEVYCDEHGRIKILPHWDRLSPMDEGSSWWVRVAQGVAGPGWGMMFLPRVGMEVVVDFIDGDPDRPIVVGCLYNGANPTPYALPDDKTKSTIKSNSTPGGGGYNELRFEDQSGAEEVYLHAQRDLNAVVGASKTLSVGANATDTIGANRTSTIGANDTTTVGANKTVTVAANYAESCGANHSVSVGASESISVGAAQSVSVGAAQSVSVGAVQSVSVSADRSLSVGGNLSNSVTGNQSTSVTGDDSLTVTGSQTTSVTGAHSLTLSAGSTISVGAEKSETVGAGYTLTITGALTQSASGDASLGAATYKVEAGTVDLIAGGTKITLTGSSITLDTGGPVSITSCGKVTLSGGNVEISGGPIDIKGGDVNVTGGTIKLN
ncbi:MAG: type VI secretion system tip protein TssI/VgrG [Nannocystaceae bacterium]